MQVHDQLVTALPRPPLLGKDHPYPLNGRLMGLRTSLDGLEERNLQPHRHLNHDIADVQPAAWFLYQPSYHVFPRKHATRLIVTVKLTQEICWWLVIRVFRHHLALCYVASPEQLLNCFSSRRKFKDPLLSSQNPLSAATLSHHLRHILLLPKILLPSSLPTFVTSYVL